MLRMFYITFLVFLILYPKQVISQDKQEETAGDYTIELYAGWNAISFLDPPDAANEFPNSIEWLVVPRNGKLLIYDLKGGQAPLDYSTLLPESIRSEFEDIAELDIDSLKPYEGCIVFCSEDTKMSRTISELKALGMPNVPVGSWTLLGLPIGSYGVETQDFESGFHPPKEVPFLSFFGITKSNKPEIFYLSTNQPDPKKPNTRNDLSHVWKNARLDSKPNGSWRDEWKLRQGEAIWIKTNEKHLAKPDLQVTAIEDVKIELEQIQQEENIQDKKEENDKWKSHFSKSVILSLGSSLNYIDLKTSLARDSSPCLVHLKEVDWYKADIDWYERNEKGRPTKDTLLSILNAASKDLNVPPGEGFVRIENRENEPNITFSHKYTVLPYLESSHGPWSYNRSIRINTERMTKGSRGEKETNIRILEPGIYLGRLKMISSARNQATLPNVLIILEVPELYGGYEGSVAAQVLSIRGDDRMDPRTFFAKKTNRDVGTEIPFGDLQKAARPGADSIQIGTFPIRVRFLPNDDSDSAMILQDGSFLVNEDYSLNMSYKFTALQNDFHAVNVSLDKAKKTLFLNQTLFCKVKTKLVPLLGTPQGMTKNENSEQNEVEIQREVNVLLQEEASGYLQGVFIERLGRSKSQTSRGGIVRRSEKNIVTGKVSNYEQAIYVIGEIKLFRTTSMNQEKMIADKEKKD